LPKRTWMHLVQTRTFFIKLFRPWFVDVAISVWVGKDIAIRLSPFLRCIVLISNCLNACIWKRFFWKRWSLIMTKSYEIERLLLLLRYSYRASPFCHQLFIRLEIRLAYNAWPNLTVIVVSRSFSQPCLAVPLLYIWNYANNVLLQQMLSHYLKFAKVIFWQCEEHSPSCEPKRSA